MIIRHLPAYVTDATGGEDGSRTHDLLNAIQTLSQTELQPHMVADAMVHDTMTFRKALVRKWCPRRDSNPHGRSHLILSQARLPIPSLGQIIRICLFPDHQHQWVRSNYEFQKLTKVILFCYRPVSGFTGKPIRVFVFSLFKTRILYKNRPLEFPF